MAGHVTEAEILSLLRETFRRAAEHCDKLAVVPARGPVYQQLRKDLQTAENCCRQIAQYRAHHKWLDVGLFLAETHTRAGGWLRDRTMPRTSNSNLAHPLFLKLAEKLRFGAEQAERLATLATGRIGPVLPTPLPAPSRTEGRIVQVKAPPMTRGGIILPPGMAA